VIDLWFRPLSSSSLNWVPGESFTLTSPLILLGGSYCGDEKVGTTGGAEAGTTK
jgi:hypothetical protein